MLKLTINRIYSKTMIIVIKCILGEPVGPGILVQDHKKVGL